MIAIFNGFIFLVQKNSIFEPNLYSLFECIINSISPFR